MEYIDIKKFVEEGFLQEANRQFFHPIGMALTVNVLDNGDFVISGIKSNREETKSGIVYDIEKSKQHRIDIFNKKRNFILKDAVERITTRKMEHGFDIEPVPKSEKSK